MQAVEYLAQSASATVELGLHKGNILFRALKDCPGSLYLPEHASMEASTGLNPASAQGYTEVHSVEARALAKAGRIRSER